MNDIKELLCHQDIKAFPYAVSYLVAAFLFLYPFNMVSKSWICYFLIGDHFFQLIYMV